VGVVGECCAVLYLGEGGKKKVEELEEEEESERCLTKIDNPILRFIFTSLILKLMLEISNKSRSLT